MKTDRKSEHPINRRDFLKLGGAAIGLLATARLTAAFAAEPAWVTVGSEADFALDQPVSVAGGKAFVVRRAAGLSALSALCTHRSCRVTPEGNEFICPCHQARFGLGGEVLNGPAREPLSAIPVKVEAGQVLVQI
jgi:Rieske Fe-S protein